MQYSEAQMLLGANFRMNNPEKEESTVGEVAQGIGAVPFHDCAKEWDTQCPTCQHDMEIVNNDCE